MDAMCISVCVGVQCSLESSQRLAVNKYGYSYGCVGASGVRSRLDASQQLSLNTCGCVGASAGVMREEHYITHNFFFFGHRPLPSFNFFPREKIALHLYIWKFNFFSSRNNRFRFRCMREETSKHWLGGLMAAGLTAFYPWCCKYQFAWYILRMILSLPSPNCRAWLLLEAGLLPVFKSFVEELFAEALVKVHGRGSRCVCVPACTTFSSCFASLGSLFFVFCFMQYSQPRQFHPSHCCTFFT